MYSTCPKCQQEIPAQDVGAQEVCPACGLVFAKWLQRQAMDEEAGTATNSNASTVHSSTQSIQRSVFAGFFMPQRKPRGHGELTVYALIWAGLLWFGLDFIQMNYESNEIGRSFMHSVNLVFHEAGHMLFMPLGRTMTVLGGSLFQVLLPVMLMCAFLIINKDAFGAAVCLWWSGQSLLDLAPYIADATVQRLPLLGGGTGADRPGFHDWNTLLRPRGWLEYDQQIAVAADRAGALIIIVALCWGALALWREWRERREWLKRRESDAEVEASKQ